MSSGETVAKPFIERIIEDIIYPDRPRVAVIPYEIPYMQAGGVPSVMRVALAFTSREARICFIQGAPFLLYDGEEYESLSRWHREGGGSALPVFILTEGFNIYITPIRTPVGRGGFGPAQAVQGVRFVIQTPTLSYNPEDYLRNCLVDFTASDIRLLFERLVEIHQARGRPDAHRMNGYVQVSIYFKADAVQEELLRDEDLRRMVGGATNRPLTMPAIYRIALYCSRKVNLVAYPHSTIVVLCDKSMSEAIITPLLRLRNAPPLDDLEAVEAYVSTAGTCFLFLYFSRLGRESIVLLRKDELQAILRDRGLQSIVSSTTGQLRQLHRITMRAASATAFAQALTQQTTITEHLAEQPTPPAKPEIKPAAKTGEKPARRAEEKPSSGGEAAETPPPPAGGGFEGGTTL